MGRRAPLQFRGVTGKCLWYNNGTVWENMKTYVRLKFKHPIGKTLLAIGIITGIAFSVTLTASALPGAVLNRLKDNSENTSISPNPYSLLLYKQGNDGNWNSWGASMFNPPGGNNQSSGVGFKHLLKNEQTSNIRKLILRAYYKTLGEAQSATISVRSDWCNFSARNGGPTPDTDGDPNNNSGTEENHRLEVLVNGVRRFYSNATQNNTPAVCNNFENANYSASGTPVRAPSDANNGTGMYFNQYEFILHGNRYTSGGQQIRFQARASGTGVIGLKKQALPTEFGVAENFNQFDHNVAVSVPFGASCKDPDNQPFSQISIYDGDLEVFGNTYVFILKRTDGGAWEKLAQNEYGDVGTPYEPVRAVWEGGNERFRLTATTGQSSILYLKNFRQNTDYLLVLDNPDQTANHPPGNVLSFEVPGDSINTQVDCDYNLTPGVTQQQPAGAFTGDANFNVQGTIDIDDAVDTDAHLWQLSVVNSPNRPANVAAATNSSLPCAWQSNCSVLATGSDPDGFEADFATAMENYQQSDTPIGTWICFFMSVSKPTDTSAAGVWAHSALICNVSGREPRIQVWGYDARVVSNINTSTTTQGTELQGSWGEYGILSNGTNTNMGSGSGLLNGSTTATQSGWSGLTFANTSGGGLGLPQFGGYGGVTYPTTNETITETYLTRSEGGPIASGTRRVVQVGTLTITSDMIYDDDGPLGTGYSSITQIPRVVFIADEIIIDASVRRIDPWLIANRITTCDDARDGSNNYFLQVSEMQNYNLHSGMCNLSLKFNGPVISDSIYLMRTTAPTATDDNPAETFNLRSDAFLSSMVGGGGEDPVATTDQITDVPPRF